MRTPGNDFTGQSASLAMKRHVLLALFRVLLAIGVMFALPFSHMQWGEAYPGDGQEAFGFIVIFTLIGFVAAGCLPVWEHLDNSSFENDPSVSP